MSKKRTLTIGDKLLVGCSEWCQLPELKIFAIKARVDTGAKTSSLHAFNINRKKRGRRDYVDFEVCPLQANRRVMVPCSAELLDQRSVMSSNGHKELRYVISTPLSLGGQRWNIELTLSNRDPMRFRMLLGREALSRRVLVDPNLVCNQGKVGG